MQQMRKTVNFSTRTLRVADRLANANAYKKALAELRGPEAVKITNRSESARLRELAEIGAQTVEALAEDAGYEELAELYEEERSLYREFQDDSLGRKVFDEEPTEALFEKLAEL